MSTVTSGGNGKAANWLFSDAPPPWDKTEQSQLAPQLEKHAPPDLNAQINATTRKKHAARSFRYVGDIPSSHAGARVWRNT